MSGNVKRKLAAILSLDVVSYTEQMARDPAATLVELQRVLRGSVRPIIRDHDGRIVKFMGDGVLVEFGTAVDAIVAAECIQLSLKADAVQLRAGIHVGDVTESGADIFGDAVNIAARLQASAPIGGVLISKTTIDVAGGGLKTTLKSEGSLRLKGLAEPIEVSSIDFGGDAQLGEISRSAKKQSIRFATSADGTRLAWTTTGEGSLLVKAPNWVTHLELDWSIALQGWLPQLSAKHQLVRFDARCNGLSDRDVSDISLQRFVDDLEAVFDAANIERAPVFGYSFGGTVAAAFAARNPDRVSGLILMSSFVEGLKLRESERDSNFEQALATMSNEGWNDSYPSVRDFFAQRFSPESNSQDQRAFAEFMRTAISANDYKRIGDSVGSAEITELLPKISCPTLVMHASRETIHGQDQCRRLAAGIPNARFVGLDSANNIIPAYDPAWQMAVQEIETFIETL